MCIPDPVPPSQSNFTFQSGSIQIRRFGMLSKFHKLYIPIWFYSNAAGIAISAFAGLINFTFQSGSIQIPIDFTEGLESATLHSNLVLFK